MVSPDSQLAQHNYQAILKLFKKRKNFSGVVYAHKLRVFLGHCVRDLEIIAKAAYPEELAHRVPYLPL